MQVNDTSYTWGSGTSMAAPHVAGVVAIYLEQQPKALPSEVSAPKPAKLHMMAMKCAQLIHMCNALMRPQRPDRPRMARNCAGIPNSTMAEKVALLRGDEMLKQDGLQHLFLVRVRILECHRDLYTEQARKALPDAL